jgi:spermidine synthase
MPPALLSALAAFTSAAVLVIEIVAARLLAPYVGVTLETYTAIIGTVLAGIAGGAWLGGRLADRTDPIRALPGVLILGGILTLLSVPLVRFLGDRLTSSSPSSVIGLTAAAFLAPSIVLSMVTPLLVKAKVVDLLTTGRTIGSLSALSTMGALFGSFTTGFILIPRFRSRIIIGIVGALIIGLGVFVWFITSHVRGGKKMGSASLGVLLAVGGGGFASTSTWREQCEIETAYFCASVLDDSPTRKTLLLDDVLHSAVDTKDPTYLEFDYIQAFNATIDAWRPEPAKVRALHIGGGGFTMPRELKATRPGSYSLVLEIDKKLVKLDQKRLALKLASDLQTRGGDGRMGMRQQADDSYDLVIGDAFGGQSVPWHLTTQEVHKDIDRVLIDDGLYVLNTIDNPPLKFVKAEIATVKSVFPEVAVISFPEAFAGAEGANFIVVASRRPLPMQAIQQKLSELPDRAQVAITETALDRFVGNAKVLTDELAPVADLITVE